MPDTTSISISDLDGLTLGEFTHSRILDESNIKEIGDSINAALARQEFPKLLLDFGTVEHLSSAALGMLINVNNRIRARNGQLRLACIRPQILEVFAITKLNKLFRIFPTRDEAKASFAR
jgi:anti-sigma B factor antagonist